MEKELANFPERFSPNVILRGLFQETILPNIAFVGGGGEMAYWLELKPLFHHYQVPYPVLILRNSFLLIKEKLEDENWKKLVFLTDEIFKPEEKMMEDYVRINSARQLSLDKQIVEIEGFL